MVNSKLAQFPTPTSSVLQSKPLVPPALQHVCSTSAIKFAHQMYWPYFFGCFLFICEHEYPNQMCSPIPHDGDPEFWVRRHMTQSIALAQIWSLVWWAATGDALTPTSTEYSQYRVQNRQPIWPAICWMLYPQSGNASCMLVVGLWYEGQDEQTIAHNTDIVQRIY